MVITDKYRRDVAQVLRSFHESIYLDSELRDTRVTRTIRFVLGDGDIFQLLADLIDRETCRNEGSGNRFVCSACRYKFVDDSDYAEDLDWAFCPNCGAEVIDD